MTRFKDGWTQVRFGDVVRLSSERCADPLAQGIERYVGLEDLEPDDLRIRTWGLVADGVTFTNRFRPGQVLFGKRRAYQRKVAVAEFDGVCSSDIYVFEPADDRLLPGLLPFVCQAEGFFQHALKTSAGSLSPRTNWASLADYEFALPPLSEQTRLVPVLEASARTLDCFRESNRQAVSLLEALRDEWVASRLSPAVNAPPSGDRILLADLFNPVIDKGYRDLPILAVTVNGEIVGREELGRHVSDETGPEKCLRVLPGDIAYNTMRLWQGSVGVTCREGLLSPAYTVIRPTTATISDSVWVDVFRSRPLQREYRKLVRGIAKDRWRIYFADLATVSFARTGVASLNELARMLDEVRAVIESQARRAADTNNVLQLIAKSMA